MAFRMPIIFYYFAIGMSFAVPEACNIIPAGCTLSRIERASVGYFRPILLINGSQILTQVHIIFGEKKNTPENVNNSMEQNTTHTHTTNAARNIIFQPTFLVAKKNRDAIIIIIIYHIDKPFNNALSA